MNNTTFYKKSIKEYGISAQGVHWNSKYTQYKRFEILTKFIKKDIKTSTIVDAGCGFADLYKYLKSNNKLPLKYIGIDSEEIMINPAKKLHPTLELYVKNILIDELIEVDYYICSGAMNILKKEEVFLFIKRCFLYSKKGFIFNFLKSLSFNNVSIEEVLEYCNTLSDNIKIKDNYLENDISIMIGSIKK